MWTHIGLMYGPYEFGLGRDPDPGTQARAGPEPGDPGRGPGPGLPFTNASFRACVTTDCIGIRHTSGVAS